MLYLNNACSEKSNIKIILKRAMWRKRAKNYLKHMELDKSCRVYYFRCTYGLWKNARYQRIIEF